MPSGLSSAVWAGSRSTVSLWRWAPRWARILIAPMRAEPIPQQHHLLTGLKPLRWSSTPIRPVGIIAVVRERKHSRALVPSGGAESDTHYLLLIRGHWCATQCWIASSSRSLAWR
jgi:hypothetical protein